MPSSIPINVSSRIAKLPPYLFARLNKLKYEKRSAGVDVIDLGMGNPTDPTPPSVVEKLASAARDPKNHRYSVANGVAALRREVAMKYKRKYGVELDPDTEVIATIGSKEGFSHLCLALLGQGDTVVVPDPAFPIHIHATAMAGASVIRVKLGNDQNFLERIQQVISGIYPTPKMLILNFPHNPTGLTITPDFWEQAVALCQKHGVMIISDFAYGEVNFDGYRAPSLLACPGGKGLGVEFTTMSKSYNMAGWRVGFCCGNAEMVKALATIKGYYDYGLFAPVQIASIIAMREAAKQVDEQCEIYQDRRDEVCRWLDKLGWTYQKPLAGMFVWAQVSDAHLAGQDSLAFSLRMVDEAAVALSPGVAFGENGTKCVRIALVENQQRLRQAMRNLETVLMGKKNQRPRRLKP